MKMQITNGSEEFDTDEFEDETLAERLWGLTEMFPNPVRKASGAVAERAVDLSKVLYKWSRVGLWVAASSFTVLVLPVIVESERANLDEMQMNQQREMLLGPSAAYSAGSGPHHMPIMASGTGGGSGGSGAPASSMPFGFGPAPVAAK